VVWIVPWLWATESTQSWLSVVADPKAKMFGAVSKMVWGVGFGNPFRVGRLTVRVYV